MAAVQQSVALAKTLPAPLLRFFTRWPSRQLIEVAEKEAATTPVTVQTVSNTSSADPNEAATTSEATVDTTAPAPVAKKLNPFLPWRNPRTGNWHSPHYSLRRQADLFKLAKKHNVLSLMPLSPKHPEVKEQKRIEKGLRVQGTGEGRRVKGKKWERTLQSKLEDRRKAMEGMPELIRQWKQRGHGRGWKKWPR